MGQLGAFQLESLVALRAALARREIGSDFLRWTGNPDGKDELGEIMERIAYTYRISLTGASELLVPLKSDPGTTPMKAIGEPFEFESCILADYGVVEMTERFRDLFPRHWVLERPAHGVDAYILQVAASVKDVIRASGGRRHSDCGHLIAFLRTRDDPHTALLTTRSNIFCAEDPVAGNPCIIELWHDQGWHLDAHGVDDFGDLLEPGYRAFVPTGRREKKFI